MMHSLAHTRPRARSMIQWRRLAFKKIKKCTGTDLISRNVPLGPKQTSPARSDQGAPRLLGIKAALDNVFAWQRRDMQQRG